MSKGMNIVRKKYEGEESFLLQELVLS